MYLLRRTAVRALSRPSKAILPEQRTISTHSPLSLRLLQRRSAGPLWQRRFASDDVTTKEDTFSQTAPEAPIDEDLKPVDNAVKQVEDIAASTTEAASGIEALQQATYRKTGQDPRDNYSSLRRPAPEPNNTLYVGNLFYEVTPDQLSRIFSRFGTIKGVRLVYDNRGVSRGFGYVEFENLADATSALENLDMQVFEGRNLVVQYHRQRPNSESGRPDGRGRFEKSPPSKTLFIGNMSFEMTDKDLNDLFRDVRNVMDVRVAVDRRTGQPRGFAHADFLDVASATRAKELLEDKVIYGRKLRIDFSKSTPKDRQPAEGQEQ